MGFGKRVYVEVLGRLQANEKSFISLKLTGLLRDRYNGEAAIPNVIEIFYN